MAFSQTHVVRNNMNPKILIAVPILFFSCNSGQAKKQNVDSLATKNSKSAEIVTQKEPQDQTTNILTDTTSSDYLIYLLKNEKHLNNYWTKKLKVLDEFVLPLDSMSHLSLIRDWTINDSISVIIFDYSTGTSYDEFLLTIKNKKDIVSKIHISDLDDSDLSLDHPYYYTEYKLINERKVKLFNHKEFVEIEGGEEKDKILSIENWSLQDNGEVSKK